ETVAREVSPTGGGGSPSSRKKAQKSTKKEGGATHPCWALPSCLLSSFFVRFCAFLWRFFLRVVAICFTLLAAVSKAGAIRSESRSGVKGKRRDMLHRRPSVAVRDCPFPVGVATQRAGGASCAHLRLAVLGDELVCFCRGAVQPWTKVTAPAGTSRTQ